jgi:hypothetical protein
VALGDSVYGGRMGNTSPGDGYAYRGGYWIQTTGKDAVREYATALDLEPSPALLDDVAVTLRFACYEWRDSGCCEWSDENDIVKVSKAINTGSATSKVKPVGMKDREVWFAKAWSIWGEKGKADKPVATDDLKQIARDAAVKYGPVVAAVSGGGAHVATKQAETPVAPAPKPKPTAKDTLAKAQETKALVEQAKDLGVAGQNFVKWASGDGMMICVAIAVVASVTLVFPRLKEKFS